jgi:predicted DNA binding CopG/RHH family protein
MARPKTRKSIHVRIVISRLKAIDETAREVGVNRTKFIEDAADLLIETIRRKNNSNKPRDSP